MFQSFSSRLRYSKFSVTPSWSIYSGFFNSLAFFLSVKVGSKMRRGNNEVKTVTLTRTLMENYNERREEAAAVGENAEEKEQQMMRQPRRTWERIEASRNAVQTGTSKETSKLGIAQPCKWDRKPAIEGFSCRGSLLEVANGTHRWRSAIMPPVRRQLTSISLETIEVGNNLMTWTMCICRFEQGTLAIFHDCYMYAEYNDLGTFRALSVLSLWDLNILYLILCLISSPLFYTLNIMIWELFEHYQSYFSGTCISYYWYYNTNRYLFFIPYTE